MLLTQNLSISYVRHNPISFPDLQCDSKNSITIIGKSGVGKTSLLHMLAGLLKPSTGNVIIANENIFQKTEIQRDDFRRKNIGIILQKPVFIDAMNVLENIQFFYQVATEKSDEKKCKLWLEKVGLKDKFHQSVQSLSQGEAQRLSLIRALIHEPKIVLADEPSSALDDENTEILSRLLLDQCMEIGSALIIVTHDARLKNIFNPIITLS